jgi:hypothetical protein
MKQHTKTACQKLVSLYRWFISGIWFVNIVRQIIVTGGNIAESAFLLATLWVIINAVGHSLLLWFMPIHAIELFNFLSAIAFSALPELIIIPVIITCFSHWSTAYKYKSRISTVWGVLYSIPAAFFLVMTVFTITTFVSTGGTHFVPADGIQLVIRCLSGWLYAVVNMLFQKLGEPHYASKLTERDTEIERLKAEMSKLKTDYSTEKQNLLASHSHEIENLTLLLKTQSEQVNRLAEKATSLELRGLEYYPNVTTEWLNQGIKTVTVDEIVRITGHSRRRINAAKLETDRRNSKLIRVSSIIEWLKIAPLPETPVPSNGHSNGHKEGDTDPLELQALTI